ncbi:MAG: polynucleotide 5'-hydroxyl-kinase [Spirochaetia bacterium]
MSEVPAGWNALAERIRDPRCGSVYVVGETDSGKTELSRWLLEQTRARRGWYLDCDLGQSVLGPPTTVGLAEARHAGEADEAFDPPLLSFVGSTSPARHLLQTLSGIARLAREVPAEGLMVCDSSGFVSGRLGGEFQYNLINLLRPDLLVALDADESLRATLKPFESAGDIGVVHVERHPECGTKSRAVRTAYRAERFARHFTDARATRLSMSDLTVHGMVPDALSRPSVRHRLCAVLDTRQFVQALGVVLDAEIIEGNIVSIELLAPAFDRERAASVQLGSLRLSPGELRYRAQREQTSPQPTAAR